MLDLDLELSDLLLLDLDPELSDLLPLDFDFELSDFLPLDLDPELLPDLLLFVPSDLLLDLDLVSQPLSLLSESESLSDEPLLLLRDESRSHIGRLLGTATITFRHSHSQLSSLNA